MADQAAQDRLEIRELADRYTIGITTRDWDTVRSCYHADARWHASVAGLDFRGQDALVAGLRAIVEAASFVLQMQHAILIENLTADRATARSVLHEVVARPNGRGLTVLGVYNDRVGKFDGRWLFTERYFHAHYTDQSPLPGEILVDYKDLPKL
jgi:hypothetical protein